MKTEKDLEYYKALENQRKAEVEGMYKEHISMIELKRSANRDIRRQKYHQKLKEYYGKELRQRQKADADLCRDLAAWGYFGRPGGLSATSPRSCGLSATIPDALRNWTSDIGQ